MEDVPQIMYAISEGKYYRDIAQYDPEPELFEVAARHLSADWTLTTGGFWTRCTPPITDIPPAGWKIHVSSTLDHARETLGIVSRLLSKRHVPFKFCSDERMLRMSLRKGWSRFQAGKFIAVYPKDETQFKAIAAELHQCTSHLAGPYILSDRRFPESQVVFYRYGALLPDYRADRYGFKRPGYLGDDGTWRLDERGPAAAHSAALIDPFQHIEKVERPSPKGVLLNERYRVDGAIKFNVTGGVYFGVDEHTKRKVIIRERRAGMETDKGLTAQGLTSLSHQANILRRLRGVELTPEYVDLFTEWENEFLVEDRLAATSLWGVAMDFYFSDQDQTPRQSFNAIRDAIRTLAEGLRVIHDNGIVLRDISRTNVLFTAQGHVRFVDFEFSYDLNDAPPYWIDGRTPGYASHNQRGSGRPTIRDDHYALGVLIIDMITFCAAGLELDRALVLRKFSRDLKDLCFPRALYDIATGLIEPDEDRRWDLPRVLDALAVIDEERVIDQPLFGRPVVPDGADRALLIKRLQTVNEEFGRGLSAAVRMTSEAYPWPAPPELFATNTISLQYGAAGVAFYLLRSRGVVCPSVLDWISERAVSEPCPNGLYSGRAGAALLLLSAGLKDRAEELIKTCIPGEDDGPGLYFGEAGLLLTQLHFWRATNDRTYLDMARRSADHLVGHAHLADEGHFWKTDNKIYLGLGEGQSGIALALAYAAVLLDESWLTDLACSALDFDLSNCVTLAGRDLWKPHTTSKSSEPNSPHMRFGSAGVGTACLRVWKASRREKYLSAARQCGKAVTTRNTNKLWQDRGNAGFGEYLLDLYQFTGEKPYEDAAFYQAEALAELATPVSGGVGFPGANMYRVCSDFAMGGAGIGVFLDRLINRRDRIFMLDDMFPEVGHQKGKMEAVPTSLEPC